MRRFTRIKRCIADDTEYGFRCVSTGIIDDLSPEKYNVVYKIEDIETHQTKHFTVIKLNLRSVKIIDGKRIIKNEIGLRYATSIIDILRLKNFFRFPNSDFAFLEYIGSSITESEELKCDFRSISVINITSLLEAKVNLQNSPKEDADGFIVVSTTEL